MIKHRLEEGGNCLGSDEAEVGKEESGAFHFGSVGPADVANPNYEAVEIHNVSWVRCGTFWRHLETSLCLMHRITKDSKLDEFNC